MDDELKICLDPMMTSIPTEDIVNLYLANRSPIPDKLAAKLVDDFNHLKDEHSRMIKKLKEIGYMCSNCGDIQSAVLDTNIFGNYAFEIEDGTKKCDFCEGLVCYLCEDTVTKCNDCLFTHCKKCTPLLNTECHGCSL